MPNHKWPENQTILCSHRNVWRTWNSFIRALQWFSLSKRMVAETKCYQGGARPGGAAWLITFRWNIYFYLCHTDTITMVTIWRKTTRFCVFILWTLVVAPDIKRWLLLLNKNFYQLQLKRCTAGQKYWLATAYLNLIEFFISRKPVYNCKLIWWS